MNRVLDNLCRTSQVLFTVGPGGVGKTTLAAVLGLQAALSGRRTLVMTVDPALRLADALGLGKVRPGRRVTISGRRLERHGLQLRAGLEMVMLDTGRSLAAAVSRQVASRKLQRRIVEHPFFQRMCEDLAGAREYAAMEELYHRLQRGQHDLVVVDTPPANHALDFFDAPEKVLQVLDRRAWRWLMRPALLAGSVGRRTLDFSSGYIVRTLSRFTGMKFLAELASFVNLFAGALEGLRQRAEHLRQIMRSDRSAFVLVAVPEHHPAEQALRLGRRLAAREMTPRLLVVNRCQPPAGALPGSPGWQEGLVRRLVAEEGAGEAAARRAVVALERGHRLQRRLALRDRRRLAALERQAEGRFPLATVALLEQDVHDIAGLEQIRRQLFAPAEARSAPAGREES